MGVPLQKVENVFTFFTIKMLRTKIIVHSSTTPEEVLGALPSDFEGHVTFDVGARIQVCMIHHKKCIKPKQIYDNLGIELHGYIPRFLYKIGG